MKTILLTQNKVVKIDDSDFEWAARFSWHATKSGKRFYARRREGWKGKLFSMHRELLVAPEGKDVDHIDGDGLNNQRSNLRIVSRSQNLCGFLRKKEGATSRFRGVCWDSTEKKWLAQIRTNQKNKYLGRFDSELLAAEAYRRAQEERNQKFNNGQAAKRLGT